MRSASLFQVTVAPSSAPDWNILEIFKRLEDRGAGQLGLAVLFLKDDRLEQELWPGI